MYQHDPRSGSTETSDVKLYEIALTVMGETGLASVTGREISKRAGISASGFVYRFGSRNAFLSGFTNWMRDRDAEYWSQLQDRLGQETGPASLQALSRAIVFERAVTERNQILGLWDIHIASSKTAEFQDLVSGWRSYDIRFWNQALTTAGLPATLTEGWAGCMLICMRILALSDDFASAIIWVDDIICRLHERLTGQTPTRPGDSAARLRAERAYRLPRPSFQDETATPARIIRAASEHILSESCASLSHRIISRRAGVSLSSTTHHFESLKDILVASFEAIYADARRPAEHFPNAGQTYTKSDFIHIVFPGLGGEGQQVRASSFAMEDIMLSASRNTDARRLSTALLAISGSTMVRLISCINDSARTYDRLDGHVLRIALSGLLCGYDLTGIPSKDSPFTSLLDAYL